MNNPYHPPCGKSYPAGNQAGHCAKCCETFIGQTAFDMHRVGLPGSAERHCEIQPYETTGKHGKPAYGHWQDDKGYFHYGRKADEAEKERMKAYWKTSA